VTLWFPNLIPTALDARPALNVAFHVVLESRSLRDRKIGKRGTVCREWTISKRQRRYSSDRSSRKLESPLDRTFEKRDRDKIAAEIETLRWNDRADLSNYSFSSHDEETFISISISESGGSSGGSASKLQSLSFFYILACQDFGYDFEKVTSASERSFILRNETFHFLKNRTRGLDIIISMSLRSDKARRCCRSRATLSRSDEAVKDT